MAPGHFWEAWALAPEHQHDVWRDDQTNQQIKERDALDRKANTIGPAKLAEIKRLFEQGQKARADLKLNQAMMIFNKIKAANVPPYSSTAAIILNTELPLHPVPKDCEERFRRADRDLSQGRLDSLVFNLKLRIGFFSESQFLSLRGSLVLRLIPTVLRLFESLVSRLRCF